MPSFVSDAFYFSGREGGLLTNQEDIMSPQPAVSGSFNNSTFPIKGGMVRNITTRHLLLGSRMQPKMPIQMATICTAPEGDVNSIVWNLSYFKFLMIREAN